jgi:hypothetical protein
MSKRNCHPPHHESPHEQRLREIVDELVPEDSQKDAYVAFAMELMAVERHERLGTRSEVVGWGQSPAFRTPRSGTVPTTSVMSSPSDFSVLTKRVVQKWFERGLRGNLLWRIGEAILDRE